MDVPCLELTAQRGRIGLRMACLPLGQDLCVTLSGGDREHIGAVALSHPGGSAVLTVPRHREAGLAQAIASRLGSHLDVAVCVACGIHVDDLRPDELEAILEMSQELTGRLLDRLKP